MSNLIGAGSGNPGNSFGGGGGGGGALIAIPLIIVATFSVKSSVLEGCGRQAGKHIDEFVPARIERPYSPIIKPFDDKPFSFDPKRHNNWEGPQKDNENEITDQFIDLGKDGVEYILEPKDSTRKKSP